MSAGPDNPADGTGSAADPAEDREPESRAGIIDSPSIKTPVQGIPEL